MTAIEVPGGPAAGLGRLRDSGTGRLFGALVLVFAGGYVASWLLPGFGVFPESWDVGFAEPIDRARRWLINNQTTHGLYTVFLNPISDAIDAAIRWIESALAWLPWYVYPAFTGVGLWWARSRMAGVLGFLGVWAIGVL